MSWHEAGQNVRSQFQAFTPYCRSVPPCHVQYLKSKMKAREADAGDGQERQAHRKKRAANTDEEEEDEEEEDEDARKEEEDGDDGEEDTAESEDVKNGRDVSKRKRVTDRDAKSGRDGTAPPKRIRPTVHSCHQRHKPSSRGSSVKIEVKFALMWMPQPVA